MQEIKSNECHSPAVWDRQVERAITTLSGPDRPLGIGQNSRISYFDAMSGIDNLTPAPMVELIAAR